MATQLEEIQAKQTAEADPLEKLSVASKEWKTHRTTIYRWWRQGKIQLVKIGPQSTRIRRSEIERVKGGGAQ